MLKNIFSVHYVHFSLIFLPLILLSLHPKCMLVLQSIKFEKLCYSDLLYSMVKSCFGWILSFWNIGGRTYQGPRVKSSETSYSYRNKRHPVITLLVSTVHLSCELGRVMEWQTYFSRYFTMLLFQSFTLSYVHSQKRIYMRPSVQQGEIPLCS